MLRSWVFLKTFLCLSTLAALGAAGCSGAEPYQFGQPIEMGPWTFEVEQARDAVETDSYRGTRRKTVDLTLRLHNFTERHETRFDDFMNGRKSGALMSISFPKIELVHKDGAAFLASVSPVSGGSLRSERWRARVWLVPDNVGIMADAMELARLYSDTPLSDLTLVIDNPDRRAGQPRRVTIALQQS